MLQAQRADGTVVQPRETVTDFRGDAWTFVHASRVREHGRAGKVIVTRGNQTRELYDSVFDLVVVDG